MEWMTVKEASELWGITGRRVQALCTAGKVNGAARLGNMWVIPMGAAKPLDGRTKAAKPNAEAVSGFPSGLAAILQGCSLDKDPTGRSLAGVYRCEGEGGALYLKIAEISDEIRREHDLLAWLGGKAPVPGVVYYGEHDGKAFLLMAGAVGFMACTPGERGNVREPVDATVKLLADALLLLQRIDIGDCPFGNPLDKKLEAALHNIEHNLVDMGGFGDGNDFESPMRLYEWLSENRPGEELCFTHGDFCLPNIFIDGGAVTGFIDLGRGGIADKWQDIALCARSLRHNLPEGDGQKYVDLLFSHLGVEPDEAKMRYYDLLDELF